jgi:hypothetical protein
MTGAVMAGLAPAMHATPLDFGGIERRTFQSLVLIPQRSLGIAGSLPDHSAGRR